MPVSRSHPSEVPAPLRKAEVEDVRPGEDGDWVGDVGDCCDGDLDV
jgi:hypothetical protein